MPDDKDELAPTWVVFLLGMGSMGALGLLFKWLVEGVNSKHGWLILLLMVVVVLLFAVVVHLGWRKLSYAFRNWRMIISIKRASDEELAGDKKFKAVIAELKKRFDAGFERMRNTPIGRNLYGIPWYVVLGASGAGKTEALRRSPLHWAPIDDVGDPYNQGVGGTIHMDWWFSREAVFLDTAGSLAVPQDRSKALEQITNQKWLAFLSMLSRARPQCPINGAVLVVSARSLITGKEKSKIRTESEDGFKDEEVEITIGEIARNLNKRISELQRNLKIRFPLYVVVSKCDELPGFREFCDKIKDEPEDGVELRQKILGWSESHPLREHKENLDPRKGGAGIDVFKTFLGFTDRIRSRCWGIIAVGGEPDEKRQSNFALLDLAGRIGLLSKKLDKFLREAIPIGGVSTLPAFVRGIYFTSALRLGSELAQIDEEEAKARNLSESWVERVIGDESAVSFFLGDLFREKMFPEKGLIMPNVEVSEHLKTRQRRALWVGVCIASLSMVLMVAGYLAYANDVKKESRSWEDYNAAKSPAVENVLKAEALSPLPSQLDAKVAQWHSDLALQVSRPLGEGYLAWPFRFAKWLRGLDEKRKQAQRFVFEKRVVEPAKSFSLRRMSLPVMDPGTFNTNQVGRLEKALQALVELQVPQAVAVEGRPLSGAHLAALLQYACDDSFETNQAQVTAFQQVSNTCGLTYPISGSVSEAWPPQSLGAVRGWDEQPELRSGVTNFFKATSWNQAGLRLRLDGLNQLLTTARFVKTNEENLWSKFLDSTRPKFDAFAPLLTNVSRGVTELTNSHTRYQLFSKAWPLSASNELTQVISSSWASQQVTRAIFIRQLPQPGQTQANSNLVVKIDEVGRNVTNVLIDDARKTLTNGAELDSLDRVVLSGAQTQAEGFKIQERVKVYEDSLGLSTHPLTNLVGNLWTSWTNVVSSRGGSIRSRISAEWPDKARLSATNMLVWAQNSWLEAAIATFGQQATNETLAHTSKFSTNSLFNLTPLDIAEAKEWFVDRLGADLSASQRSHSDVYRNNPVLQSCESNRTNALGALASSLLDKVRAEITQKAHYPIDPNSPKSMEKDDFRTLDEQLMKVELKVAELAPEWAKLTSSAASSNFSNEVKVWRNRLEAVWDKDRNQIRTLQIGFAVAVPGEADTKFFRFGRITIGNKILPDVDLSKILEESKIRGNDITWDQSVAISVNVILFGDKTIPAVIESQFQSSSKWAVFRLLAGPQVLDLLAKNSVEFKLKVYGSDQLNTRRTASLPLRISIKRS